LDENLPEENLLVDIGLEESLPVDIEPEDI
jgi:hypothetical protein